MTDLLEMRATASLIVTMFFGHEDAPAGNAGGAVVFALSRGVQAVGVLIPQ
ncbi:hypothetical protein [Micromonospora sp. CB01531]|uniref:hypothetical protein n=1 Tax=Micromonospora sp. CB01531 TaxID=1718947 RepID=UPI000B33B3E1|nr:hypothetical protein [Micromonospora sp. CB01531]